MRKKIIAGNWKMNKTITEGCDLIREIMANASVGQQDEVAVVIAPPFTHLQKLSELTKTASNIFIAAQDCNENRGGAYTGEISAEMIKDAGAHYVIIGHSERRNFYNETDALLALKVSRVISAGLIPIFCVGELLTDRNSNNHLEAVRAQLKNGLFHLSPADFKCVVLAYEPVWAIGTGVTATSHQAQGMHNYIRSEINKKYGKEISEQTTILYGGSCNPQNAKELFACMDVDGGLIGGASLKSEDFISIIQSI
jgi:triosephosphate isomerase (TIM)